MQLHNPYDAESPSRLYVEFFFALICSRLRYASMVDWHPREIWLTHSAPARCDNGHRLFFQCPVRFNQPVNQLTLEREFLEFSLPYADPLLSETLEHHARWLLAVGAEDDVLRDVRRALYDGCIRGDVRLQAIAKKLAFSCRSLQRELNSRGTSYRDELDRFRRDLALDMLPRSPIDEIAAFLRFSEPSSFYRAFRRWTGKTPQEYRELRAGADSAAR